MVEVPVAYSCSCDDAWHSSAPPTTSISGKSTSINTPLASLYYCPNCPPKSPSPVSLRCSRCINHELTLYACPNCLFNSGSTSNHSGGGGARACSRACYSCPQCQSTCIITSSSPTASSLSPVYPPMIPQNKPASFVIKCTWCSYDSGRVNGLSFGSSTGIALTHPSSDSLPDSKEFQALRLYYQNQWMYVNNPTPKTKFHLHFPPQEMETANELPSAFQSTWSGSQQLASKSPLSSQALRSYAIPVTDTTTVQQRHAQLVFGYQPTTQDHCLPLKMPLSATYTKRCGTCQRILVKPDPMKSTSFKIKHLARDVIPAIRVVQPAQDERTLTLVVTNPCAHDIWFTMQEVYHHWCLVGQDKHTTESPVFAAPPPSLGTLCHWTLIEGRKESWEYHDPIAKNTTRLQFQKPASLSEKGISKDSAHVASALFYCYLKEMATAGDAMRTDGIDPQQVKRFTVQINMH